MDNNRAADASRADSSDNRDIIWPIGISEEIIRLWEEQDYRMMRAALLDRGLLWEWISSGD